MRTGRRRTDVRDRLAALDEALALAEPRLDGEPMEAALAVRVKARERLAQGAEAVVAALAGGTGTGKSSLFNALAGEQLAAVGARRPVTSQAMAWSVGDPADTAALLDWLGVQRRHHTRPSPEAPEGLVIIDLPDHDSVVTESRALSDRFVERVDVLVWVVDPLKYAQRVLHEGELRRLATHADIVVVVLNQIDRLGADERRACERDLRRLLAEEGLGAARVLTTSAATGEGVAQLRGLLADEARRRRAVGARLEADVRAAAAALAAQTGPPVGAALDGAGLVDALGRASGLDTLTVAAGVAYRTEAKRATRPLLSRGAWAIASRLLHPLRRRSRPLPARAGAGESQAPSPAAVRHALLRIADTYARTLPAAWRSHLRDTVRNVAEAVPRAIGRVLGDEPLYPQPKPWWLPVAVLWSLVELVAFAGLVWLCTLAVIAWLQLPVPPAPDAVGRVPWPTALLLGGALAWLLVGLMRGALVGLGASRHRRRTLRRLRQRVSRVAEEHALAPLRSELEAHDALASALDRAAR